MTETPEPTSSAEIEVELKLGLEEPAQLDALLAVLPAPSSVREQRNVYLEDPDGVLSDARVMVRGREAWDVAVEPHVLKKVVLTMKRRTTVKAGVFRAEEYEQQLPVAAWDAFLRGEGSLFDVGGSAIEWLRVNFPVRSLSVLGEMVNRRHAIEVDGLVLEVDRTSFPGGNVEVEVEVETTDIDRARAIVYGAARDASATLFEQGKGKFERFLRYAGKI